MRFLAQLSGDYLSLFLSGVAGLILLSIGLIAFFVVYQRRLFAQERERVAAENLYQKQLLSAAVEVQESERKRIAGDLHDDIGSLLTATRLYLRQLKPDGTLEQIGLIKDKSLEIIDDMIQNTRRISHDLLPPTLDKFGFQAAAEDLCERFDQSDGHRVVFHGNMEGRLPRSTELALYRVLQELLNNTIKHARAHLIRVSIDQDRESFTMIYTDDGQGFDVSTNQGAGLGLRNIESRVQIEGGELHYVTAPGEGLKVEIKIPIAKTSHTNEL